jgi:hypothetical protein
MQQILEGQEFFEKETTKYFEAHPGFEAQYQRAQKVYESLGKYLHLTQPRIILHEGSGSNTEVDLSATLSRTNNSTT